MIYNKHLLFIFAKSSLLALYEKETTAFCNTKTISEKRKQGQLHAE